MNQEDNNYARGATDGGYGGRSNYGGQSAYGGATVYDGGKTPNPGAVNTPSYYPQSAWGGGNNDGKYNF